MEGVPVTRTYALRVEEVADLPGDLFVLPCVNCGRDFLSGSKLSPNCSLRCKAESKAVRYARKKFAQYPLGQIPADIVEAMKIKYAFAMSGGYDDQARRLSPETRAAVVERDGGICALCGSTGQEIDHIAGASPDLTNLRLLCRDCHLGVTQSHFAPITEEQMKRRMTWLRMREMQPEPMQPCDDVAWEGKWHDWVREHRQPVDRSDTELIASILTNSTPTALLKGMDDPERRPPERGHLSTKTADKESAGGAVGA